MMDKIEKEDLYNSAWEHWGASTQIDMLIEEMAELTQALLKTRRNGVTYSYAVYEEMADVLICLEQMETMLRKFPRLHSKHFCDDNGFEFDTVLAIKERKLYRLKERLAEDIGVE